MRRLEIRTRDVVPRRDGSSEPKMKRDGPRDNSSAIAGSACSRNSCEPKRPRPKKPPRSLTVSLSVTSRKMRPDDAEDGFTRAKRIGELGVVAVEEEVGLRRRRFARSRRSRARPAASASSTSGNVRYGMRTVAVILAFLTAAVGPAKCAQCDETSANLACRRGSDASTEAWDCNELEASGSSGGRASASIGASGARFALRGEALCAARRAA